VVRGENLGKKIGFATANLSAPSEQFPPNGAYLAQPKLTGTVYPGVLDLGDRPIANSRRNDRALGIYPRYCHHDIYGKNVEVRFVRYLRPEQKFENLDVLARQIAVDVEQARKLCVD